MECFWNLRTKSTNGWFWISNLIQPYTASMNQFNTTDFFFFFCYLLLVIPIFYSYIVNKHNCNVWVFFFFSLIYAECMHWKIFWWLLEDSIGTLQARKILSIIKNIVILCTYIKILYELEHFKYCFYIYFFLLINKTYHLFFI